MAGIRTKTMEVSSVEALNERLRESEPQHEVWPGGNNYALRWTRTAVKIYTPTVIFLASCIMMSWEVVEWDKVLFACEPEGDL